MEVLINKDGKCVVRHSVSQCAYEGVAIVLVTTEMKERNSFRYLQAV